MFHWTRRITEKERANYNYAVAQQLREYALTFAEASMGQAKVVVGLMLAIAKYIEKDMPTTAEKLRESARETVKVFGLDLEKKAL